MKHGRIAAVAAGLFSASAFAQSSVTLYGVMDTGIEYVSHANAAGDHVIRMPGITGEVPSRWGMRGAEDLGGRLKATFVLESGFNPRGGDSGQGGRLFGRQAWVGLEGPWGALTFGRQYTMTYWAMADADILGPDIYGIGSLDAFVPNARSDNTVVYKGKFYGVTIGASWSFGRDSAGTGNSPGQGTCAGQVPGDANQCREWSAMLKYDGTYFGVATAYDEQRGGTNAAANFFDGTAPFPIKSSGDKDARLQANGYVNLAGVKIGGGWLGRRVESGGSGGDVRSNLFYVGAQYYVTPTFAVDGEAYRVIVQQQDARATMASLRASSSSSRMRVQPWRVCARLTSCRSGLRCTVMSRICGIARTLAIPLARAAAARHPRRAWGNSARSWASGIPSDLARRAERRDTSDTIDSTYRGG
ncbi:Porin (modular protein) [Paraburkholderia piptadeniae]|uniref:Porin (Modular protein) n=1 Tax=Paraburkholderia piptadeniae TaxID=1701573 RepID=A0A1N7S9S5_9BURK|nr:Porin (modular protein) [Paraburkholderia piptadeniae]